MHFHLMTTETADFDGDGVGDNADTDDDDDGVLDDNDAFPNDASESTDLMEMALEIMLILMMMKMEFQIQLMHSNDATEFTDFDGDECW